MKKISSALVLFGALACSLLAKEKPNIVYILCDDLGIGDVGIHNPAGKIPTPHIDRLGREGMVFTDAHSNSSVCTPTRYGILTGRYAWRSRLKEGVLFGYDTHLIESGRMTVPSFLKEQGYHTAGIGKWHLGWDWALNSDNPKDVDYTKPIENGPTAIGFDYFFGHSASLDIPPYVWVENDMPTAAPNRITEARKQDVGNGWWRKGPTAPDFDHREVMDTITDRSIAYIEDRSKHDQPFFLYVPYASPHTPVLPTQPYTGSSGLESAYADFVTMNDAHIGKIMTALEEAGISENTLIIVTSDNGCSPAADFERLEAQGHDPSAGYRGHKADIFEGGHRVPFVVRWPARVNASSVCDDTTCLTDLLATCADIMGTSLPVDAGEDSVSMLPKLLGTAKAPVREATVHHSINGTFAIRQGPWKLIDAPHSGGWSDPRPRDKSAWAGLPAVQLYNLESDPGERHNLEAQHPEVVARLLELLKTYKTADRSTALPSSKSSGPYLGNGVKVGEVDQDSAVVWVRLTAQARADFERLPIFTEGLKKGERDSGRMPTDLLPGHEGEVLIQYRAVGGNSPEILRSGWQAVDPDRDYIAQVPLTGLKPNSQYNYEVWARPDASAGRSAMVEGSFRTAPEADDSETIRFIVTTCQAMRSIDSGPEGHHSYQQMLGFDPHFFVHTGDILYYDKAPLAKNVAEARAKWNLMFAYGHKRRFHQQVTSYFMKDDHDTLKNDCWPGQSYGDLTWDQGLALFREQVPMREKTYRTVRWGKDVQIWMTENRDFRSPNTMPDGPEKTILGDEQKAWLKRTLLESDASYKFVITPGPIVGPDKPGKNDNHSNPGFSHEGQELRDFLSQVENTYVITGDRHWQYCSEDPKTGLVEMGCGPINDEHDYGGNTGYQPEFHRFFSGKGGFLGITVEDGQARAEWFGRDADYPKSPVPIVRHREVL